MILTYYQSVELMTFLPVLLSPADAKTNVETVSRDVVSDIDQEENTAGIYQMWHMPTTGMEVNGAAFY